VGVGRLGEFGAPGLRGAFDVKSFAHYADFAPRVPVWRHEDAVAVYDVVF